MNFCSFPVHQSIFIVYNEIPSDQVVQSIGIPTQSTSMYSHVSIKILGVNNSPMLIPGQISFHLHNNTSYAI